MTSGGNNFNYFPENRTSLMLHFLQYAKIFQSSKGGHGPSGPMVYTPLYLGNGNWRPCVIAMCCKHEDGFKKLSICWKPLSRNSSVNCVALQLSLQESKILSQNHTACTGWHIPTTQWNDVMASVSVPLSVDINTPSTLVKTLKLVIREFNS